MAFTPINQLVGRFLKQKNLAQIALASQITENWSKIAAKLLPSPLDKEVVAISYRQGRLLLRVPSSLAAQEVQFKQLEIIAAFKELLAEDLIQNIRFRVIPLTDEQDKKLSSKHISVKLPKRS
ncbi:MAG: hypothetical protein A2788_00195 [Candidatus Abawacabacteria bacterium RIFCSPHIGHO2_01_FULL_46_8]|uniref:DUF721 domain-containing protein n=1 Tax=Candidatus Abawacabacteria bacterium RIFCSPHIGHO2_01_FULL_46_8 TaxID=1817815 RepID=A0A1F4XLM2_9BACT|nr:MAG: hypothetical protein A2788_00195 [Candidatus Abawacabacteria bacterium RIFCSPHIGHO2_01_FULL_46_8]